MGRVFMLIPVMAARASARHFVERSPAKRGKNVRPCDPGIMAASSFSISSSSGSSRVRLIHSKTRPPFESAPPNMKRLRSTR